MVSFKIITNKSVWEKYLLSSNQASFLQSWNWGEFHQNLHNQVFRWGIFANQQLIGLALAIKIKAKRATYWEIPGGPVIDWQNSAQVAIILAVLKTLARQTGAAFIRIRPNITFSPAVKLVKAPMHLHAETTWVLDLNLPESELLKNMRKNTRYSLKQAERLGVKVEATTKLADVNQLYLLQEETAQRNKFIPFSLKYLQQQWQAFNPDKQIQLFKATYKGQVLAISFFIFYGQEVVYHYSGSSSAMRQIPASYALQWRAILTAKKMGYKTYNFWGIAPDNNPHHRFFGVTLFKTGFGGRKVEYFPAHDLVIQPFTYGLNYIFESLRKHWRHL